MMSPESLESPIVPTKISFAVPSLFVAASESDNFPSSLSPIAIGG